MPITDSKTCPQCGAPLDANTTACKYCGAEIAVQPQFTAPQPQAPQYIPPQAPQYTQPQAAPNGAQQGVQYSSQYSAPQQQMYNQPQMPLNYNPYVNKKSKVAAGLLGIFLGAFGIHKFYTGHIGMGILYLLFCWTYIPAVVGFIEGIIYLASSDEKFNMKYVKHK